MLKLNVILALTGLSAAALDVDFSSRGKLPSLLLLLGSEHSFALKKPRT